MALNKSIIEKIQVLIEANITKKLNKYKQESFNMPFHFRLLGRDRMALYSFIQSLNTSFGTSIFEPVAVILAKERFTKVENQYVIGDEICEEAQKTIQNIINNLSISGNPNKKYELNLIKNSITKSKINKLKTVKVDLFIEAKDRKVFLFDLKTVKPNISNFKDFKRTLLEWAGIIYTKNPNAKLNTLLAIPYNPYEPKPYERWTLKGMIDDKKELLVGKEFWDFLGGDGAYEDLLDCFETVGVKLRPIIDKHFEIFK
ncbi:MAG: TdeIII family type II restriction endonuclease [Ignavibacterium sp.]|nr:TdeIII family type II restriction endonuclease [Ignavibacterium sp.]MDW8376460.1 TdeIII family type II restriction endonuclease [Ignavibacteriales bacterium]